MYLLLFNTYYLGAVYYCSWYFRYNDRCSFTRLMCFICSMPVLGKRIGEHLRKKHPGEEETAIAKLEKVEEGDKEGGERCPENGCGFITEDRLDMVNHWIAEHKVSFQPIT